MARRREYHESYAVIYVLTDLNGNVFYVGCTIKPLEFRLKLHLSDAKANRRFTNKVKNEKIRSLDYKVLIKEVDRILGGGYKGYQINSAGRKLEMDWILKYHNSGCQLTNGRELQHALKNRSW